VLKTFEEGKGEKRLGSNHELDREAWITMREKVVYNEGKGALENTILPFLRTPEGRGPKISKYCWQREKPQFVILSLESVRTIRRGKTRSDVGGGSKRNHRRVAGWYNPGRKRF